MSLRAIDAFLRGSWAPFANHLWQSTLLLVVVALLVLLFRDNRANVRFGLWLAASLKFFLPFSLLGALGGKFGMSQPAAPVQPDMLILVQGLAQPFTPAQPAHQTLPVTLALSSVLALLLFLLWLVGFLAVVISRSRGWYRLSAALRGAKRVTHGRDYDDLRALQHACRISAPVAIAYSASATAPGIFGFFLPTLVLPAGITDRLTTAHLQCIFLHELCHVRRRDNLSAALHMAVEALFWFYPPVWWIGARLVDERERACDEEVLRLGRDAQVYAESILKICEFYLESPVVCASAVAGSNLKKRIEVIMRNPMPRNLDFARKFILSSAACLALAVPVVFGLFHATQTRAQSQGPAAAFDSVYLRPNTTGEPMAPFVVYGRPMKAIQFKNGDNLLATNVSLRDLIKLAFKLQTEQILGGPGWLDSEKYDVNAKLSDTPLQSRQQLRADQKAEDLRIRIQALLSDRFQLAVQRESKALPVYALVVVHDSLLFQPAKPGDAYAQGLKDHSGRVLGPGTLLLPEYNKLVGQAISLKSLTDWLARQELGRPVIDKTGLAGTYDFSLQLPVKSANYWSESVLSAALEQQLGLKLEAQDSTIDCIVVEHAEKPVESAQASNHVRPSSN